MAIINLDDFTSQTEWSDLYYFPYCPKTARTQSLEAYFKNLKVDSVFAYHEDYPKLLVRTFVKIKKNSSILVMCEREGRMCEREGFKPWIIVEITVEKDIFFHSKIDSYFEKSDADRIFLLNNQG